MSKNSSDGLVAWCLTRLPGFEHWHNEPVPRQLQHSVQQLDDQSLMSLIAFALMQLIRRRR